MVQRACGRRNLADVTPTPLLTCVLALLAAYGLVPGSVGTAYAQADSASVDSLRLPEVTVRAGLLERPWLRTPAAVSTLDPVALTGRELALTPTDALSRVPGVSMQSGTYGTHRLMIRGQGARAPFATNRVRAYLGAIPLTDGEGGTDLEDLDLNLLGGATVLRGPAGSAYGAGLGGVVLFEPEYPEVVGSALEAEALVGRFGTARGGVRLSAGDGRAAVKLGYQRTQSDGWRDNNRYRRDNLTALARLREASRGDDGGSGPAAPSEASHTDVQLLWTGVRSEIPSALDAEQLARDPTAAGGSWGQARGFEAYDRLGVGLTRVQAFSPAWQLTASTFVRTRRANEPRPFNILRERSLATGGRAVLTYELPTRGLELALGTELFRDWYDWSTFENRFEEFEPGRGSVRGEQLSDNGERRTQLNGFAEAHLALDALAPGLSATAALAVNDTRYRLEDFATPALDPANATGRYRFGAQVSPRLALQYALGGDYDAYAQVARGFSPPTLAETLTPDGQVNPAIAPETGWNYELGLRGQGADDRWRLEAALYLLNVDDLLVARRTAEDAFVGVNAGRTRHLGLETSGAYTVGALRGASGDGLGARLYGSYAYQRHRFVDFVDGGDDFGGNAVTGVPAHEGALGVDAWRGAAWSGHVGVRGVGVVPVDDANSALAEGYAVVNARVAYALDLGRGTRFTLQLGADNLLDAAYVSMVNVNAGAFGGRAPRSFYPGRPRVVWAGVRVGFGS